MIAGHCPCGFMELADENMTDHLLLAFAPEDGIGADGRVHDEGEALTCLCGLLAASEDLDRHFLNAFTPGDAIGRDGHGHEAIASSRHGERGGR